MLLALQEREERLCKSEVAEIIRLHFRLHNLHIDGIGFRKVEASLNAGIYKDAIEVGVGARNAMIQVN